jgi:hypothetical protein
VNATSRSASLSWRQICTSGIVLSRAVGSSAIAISRSRVADGDGSPPRVRTRSAADAGPLADRA